MKVELDAVTDENGYRVVSPEGTVYTELMHLSCMATEATWLQI